MIKKAMKILVVDDFSTMRRIVRSLLKQLGFEDVDEAEDGTRALEMLMRGNFGFVVADLNMPVMDGLTLLKAIRSHPSICKIPVLMMSAEAGKQKALAAAQAGANGYIVKPFDLATLEEKITGIFEHLANE